jgi:LacI family transcriptional regulator
MDGEPDKAETYRVPPREVVQRASTDWAATGDDKIAEALQIMKTEACAGLSVDGLCKRLGLGRRTFERRLHAITGLSPDAAIRRVRILRAAQLMATTPLQIGEICQSCGFQDPLYFSKAFRKATGMSPRAWRKLPADKRPDLKLF